MALDAGTVIRASSAAMFVLLGVAVAVVGRRRADALALATLFGSVGAAIVANNLLRQGTDDVVTLKNVLLGAAALGGLAAAAMVLRGARRWPDAAFVAGLATGGVYVALLFAGGVDSLDGTTGAGTSSEGVRAFARLATGAAFLATGTFVTSISVRVARDPPRERAGWVRAAGVVASLGVWMVMQTPTLTLDPRDPWTLGATVVLVGGVTVPWLVAASRTRDRFPLLVALAPPALGCLAYAYYTTVSGSPAFFFDAWGVLGIGRLVGWSLVVYAILKADLLGVSLPHFAVSKGSVAAGALATLFIVAQVTENFLSAEYGLLTGGIVAGAFLFMAQPVQRVAERILAPPAGPGAGRGAVARVGDAAAEAVYRDALRIALRDRRVSREEELHLAELGERLGIPARRALALRHDVAEAMGGGADTPAGVSSEREKEVR